MNISEKIRTYSRIFTNYLKSKSLNHNMHYDEARDAKRSAQYLGIFNEILPYYARGMVSLDQQLEQDRTTLKKKPRGRSLKPLASGEDRVTLYNVQCRLWVMGAYEIIRTVEEKIRHDKKYAKEHEEINAIKHVFERVRIPLAKLKPPKKTPTDNAKASFYYKENLDVVWRVNENTTYSRQELSGLFCKFLFTFHPSENSANS